MNKSGTLSKDEIQTEINFYKGLYRDELNKVQTANPDLYGETMFGHCFIWGHINLCINELNSKYKLYKVVLTSACSKDPYGLAQKAASQFEEIIVSHINMD